MIQIYNPWNSNYSKNGDVALDPASCDLSIELNSTWELELVHPVDDDGKFNYIVKNAVISAPTPIGKNQLFRIYHTEKEDDDTVTASARPIFYDSAKDTILLDVRPTDLNGQECLDYILMGTKYTGTSDITYKNTAYYVRKNLMEIISGTDDNSFLNRWGGEIIYDNFNIDIKDRQGSDNGLRVEFGRNIESIKETIDMDSIATRIIPVAYNGRMLDGDEPWIDSDRIDEYPIVYMQVVKYENIRLAEDYEPTEDDDSDIVIYDTMEELQDALRAAVQADYEDGIDLPSITYDIDMLDLRRADEYKDFSNLETVSLGDTVHCRHRKLGIETEQRVIALKYDCITDSITSITLGDKAETYIDSVSDQIASVSDELTIEFGIYEQLQVQNFNAVYATIENLQADIIEAVYADIQTIVAQTITTEYIQAAVADMGFLTADSAIIQDILANYVSTSYLEAYYASIDDLEAALARIQTIEANYITADELNAQIGSIQNLFASYTTTEELEANYATIQDLTSNYLTANEIEAAYATIGDLNVINADITNLSADYANIYTLLSGSAGVGDLEAIHLTADNVVIDSAVIISAIMEDAIIGTLLSGKIYTDYVQIANNEGEQLWIDGSTIQITDDSGTVRVQIGEDASGDYNVYIWNADGTLIWNATGLTEEGLTGNGAIIKNAAVADDANISGYKLDIDSVIQCIQIDGSLRVDAAQVTIDGTTLDAVYTSLINQIGDLEMDGLVDVTIYYAIGDSAIDPPSDPEDCIPAAQVDVAVVGLSKVEFTDVNTDWTTDPLTAGEDEYLWIAYLKTYADSHIEWEGPICITDYYIREKTSTLVTELEVVQGQISSKVWLTDITDALDPIKGEITTLSDNYSTVIQTVDEISSAVGSLTTTVTDNYKSLSSQVSTITQTVEGVTSEVEGVKSTISELSSEVETNGSSIKQINDWIDAAVWETYVKDYVDPIAGEVEEINSQYADLTVSVNGISGTVSDLQSTVSENYSDVSQQIADINVSVSDISATLTNQQTIISDNYNYLYDQIVALKLTTDGIYASISEVESSIAGLQSNAVAELITYYAIGDSCEYPPSDPEDCVPACQVDVAQVGLSKIEFTDVNTDWTTEQLTPGKDEYLWIAYLQVFLDGSMEWTDPICITDYYVREQISSMGASIEVLEDAITSKVWQTDITEALDPINGSITDLDTQYSEISQTVSNISSNVTDLQSEVSSNYSILSSSISTIDQTVSGITETVEEIQQTIVGNYEDLYSRITTLSATDEGIEESINVIKGTVNELNESLALYIEALEDLESEGVANVTPYYALGSSATDPPSDPEDCIPACQVDVAQIGLSKIGFIDVNTDWTTTPLSAGEGEYLWISYLKEYLDGTMEWTEPFCATDYYVKSLTVSYGSRLDVLEDSIESVVYRTEIEELISASDTITNIKSDYTTLTQTIDSINASITSISSTVSSDYTSLDARIANLEFTANSLSSTLFSLQDTVDGWSSDSIVKVTPYFAVTSSESISPGDPADQVPACQVDVATVGQSMIGFTDVVTGWSTTVPDASGDQVIWISYMQEHEDGTVTWTDPVTYASAGYVGSQIQQLTDSITLSVSSSTNGTASIVLKNGSDTISSASGIVTNARQAFENESTSITISAGTITFDSGTLVVNSGNFTLDSSGNATFAGELKSPSGTIGGWTISSASLYNDTGSMRVFVGNATNTNKDFLVVRTGSSSDDYEYPFWVRGDGSMYASDASIEGTITSGTNSGNKVKLSGGEMIGYYKGSQTTEISWGITVDLSKIDSSKTSTVGGITIDAGVIRLEGNFLEIVQDNVGVCVSTPNGGNETYAIGQTTDAAQTYVKSVSNGTYVAPGQQFVTYISTTKNSSGYVTDVTCTYLTFTAGGYLMGNVSTGYLDVTKGLVTTIT